MAIPGYPRGQRRYHLWALPNGVVLDLGDDVQASGSVQYFAQAGIDLIGKKFDNMQGTEGFEYHLSSEQDVSQAQHAATNTWLQKHHLA